MVQIIFFKTNAGNEPVRDWITLFNKEDRKIIGADLRTVELGWPIGMPVCSPMGDGLYEVRSNISDKRITRVLFFQSNDKLVLVHGFIKKTQKTPKEDLDLAKKRKKEYEKYILHEAKKKK